ncbi:MAG: ISAs1 family transposase, partial [Dysgonamonadaceae bacterium]|nr:ISAs1 family transposase [Dysgonamonadaceae bacterium]
YITSLKADAKLINNAVRYHWSIENSLHWVLDVALNEDNRIALNLLKNEKTTKVGVRGKQLKAG